MKSGLVVLYKRDNNLKKKRMKAKVRLNRKKRKKNGLKKKIKRERQKDKKKGIQEKKYK